jgi:sterol desaturase/sphingolipid hydroxylase (fatty acid hydroxylase superfamily)
MTSGDLIAFIGHLLSTRRYEIGFVAAAILFEVLVRSRRALRLLPNGYLLDLTYCLIYRFGIYTVLIDRPINDFVFSHITWQLIFGAPVWVRVIAYLLMLDFANYWIHRIEHAVPALWAFHQIHHSQDQLSIMTTYRNHPLDVWMRGFVGPVIIMMLFGLPPRIWLWLSIVWDVTLNLSHLDVNWTYGPLRWLLVSPVSHAIHHSVEDRHQHRNYGANLAIWDRLFGTADTGTERPKAVGLPGWKVRESVLAHCWAPIRGAVRHFRGLPMDDLASLTPPDAATAAVADSPAARA